MGHAKRLASRRDFLKNTGRIATVSALASMAIPNVHAAGSDTPQSDAIEKHFLEAKKKREELRLLLEEAKNKGIDVSYPKVSWALNVLFERYIRRDLDRREYLKADYKVNSVLDSTNKAIDQIKEWIKDPSQQVRVPHISVNNLKIKDGEFCQGEEPVLLLGFVWAFPLDFVRSDFFLQSSLGFNSTEVCMGGLGLAEPDKEGELFAGWMDKLDACMKEAERNNIGVDLINQVASFASWVPETFPSIFTCSGSSDLPFCLTNPRTKELFKNYLQKIIPSIKDHPNLYSYCLVNEPRYQYAGYCSCCQKAFQDYLKGEYEDLGTLNKSWGTAYKTFREVGIPFEGRTSDSPSLSVFAYEKGALKEKVVANQHLILKPENLAPINNASMYDWQRFNQHRMAEFFTFMKGVVREADKKTAISWKSGWMTYAESGEDKGTDIEEIGRRSDVNNYDGPMSVALGGVWPSPGGNYAMNISTINGDLMKSLVPGKPIFNTEWHYGVVPVGVCEAF